MIFSEQVRVMWQLIRRDVFIVRKSLQDDVMNAVVQVSATYFAIGILSPYLGFTATIARDVMIGTILSTTLSRGFASAVTDSFDMSEDRFIDYKRTLPLSTSKMLFAFLCSYTVTLMFSTLPLFILAKIYLGSFMPFAGIQLVPFVGIYIASMIFMSAFFLSIIFCTSFDWFRFNIWQRVLIPLNSFGCFLFAWKRFHAFSPLFARFLLINPFTFIAEGLRAALFGNQAYIPVYYCAPIVFFWTIAAVVFLLTYVRKKIEAGV